MKSSDIAVFLGRELIGANIDIDSFSSLSNIEESTVVFAKKYSKTNEDIINNHHVLAIVCEDEHWRLFGTHIISASPRLDFLRVVSAFFCEEEIPRGIHPSAVIENGVKIGKGVSIGAHCYVGKNVEIGDDTIIMPNCTICSNVLIGSKCYIKSGVMLGGSGFGFENDENGIPIHFPHTGNVVLGNNVYIGANCVIDRGTIDSTIIHDNVKIDNGTLIGHNCEIGNNSIIVGGVIICGGVVIGQNAWIAPNASIHQQLKIGNNSKVGMGSVVLTNIKDDVTVFGMPARKLKIALQNRKNK